MPASCLRTLSKVSFSSATRWFQGTSRSPGARRNCSSTSCEVWRIESASRQGCRRRDTLDEVLTPGTAHRLPVMDRGGADRYLGLCLRDVDTLELFLHRLQALLGVFEVPFGLPQTTKDGQRIALGQIMAQVKQVGMLGQPRPVWASLISALARSLTMYNTLVPNVVRRSLARADQGQTAIRRHLLVQAYFGDS